VDGRIEPAALPRILAEERMEVLPVTLEHALQAGGLPGPHRDPFDRLLIAQSRLEGIPVVTRDEVFASYGVQTIW
jgi:PIN domain nuclease of toxin-antitoxin system